MMRHQAWEHVKHRTYGRKSSEFSGEALSFSEFLEKYSEKWLACLRQHLRDKTQ